MSKHHAIIKLHCAGVSNSMIIKQLKVPKFWTLYDTVARSKELGDDCVRHCSKIYRAR